MRLDDRRGRHRGRRSFDLDCGGCVHPLAGRSQRSGPGIRRALSGLWREPAGRRCALLSLRASPAFPDGGRGGSAPGGGSPGGRPGRHLAALGSSAPTGLAGQRRLPGARSPGARSRPRGSAAGWQATGVDRTARVGRGPSAARRSPSGFSGGGGGKPARRGRGWRGRDHRSSDLGGAPSAESESPVGGARRTGRSASSARGARFGSRIRRASGGAQCGPAAVGRSDASVHGGKEHPLGRTARRTADRGQRGRAGDQPAGHAQPGNSLFPRPDLHADHAGDLRGRNVHAETLESADDQSRRVDHLDVAATAEFLGGHHHVRTR